MINARKHVPNTARTVLVRIKNRAHFTTGFYSENQWFEKDDEELCIPLLKQTVLFWKELLND